MGEGFGSGYMGGESRYFSGSSTILCGKRWGSMKDVERMTPSGGHRYWGCFFVFSDHRGVGIKGYTFKYPGNITDIHEIVRAVRCYNSWEDHGGGCSFSCVSGEDGNSDESGVSCFSF